jgi:ketosteroid isomerase-like protein
MRRRIWTAGALLAGLVATGACAPPAGQAGGDAAAVDTAAILSSVDSLRSAWESAVDAEDWERLDAMATEDALIVMPAHPAWDSMRAAGPGPFPPGASIEITPRDTRVLGSDWVYEMGSSVITWTPEGADSARTLGDSYLVLLHRTADGWKVHREVASSGELPEAGG